MTVKNLPLVSIGIPVFNGEKGIALALDSLLRQDYKNLEIIISDNASTDSTAEICKNFVLKDTRLKYNRLEENQGTVVNFNLVFKLSSGKYFMWAAHDDLREPSFVSECVEKMEQCPEAALCQAYTAMFIEGHKEMLCIANLNSFEGITGLVERYKETLKHFPATAIYGLYRSSAMRKTRMFQKVIATDLAFIQELAINGSFVQVPKVLFNYSGREKWNTVHQDYRVFFGKDRKPWWYLPFIALFCNHWKRVARAALPLGVKLRLWWVLLEHELRQIIFKVLIKISGRVCPETWKEKLGCKIYFRWMCGPNLQICSKKLLLNRVIKPRLGWWR